MSKHLLLVAFLLTVSGISFGQNKIKVVALGSSTTFGLGASTFDSSWVGRARIYYGRRGLNLVDTIFDLGASGATSYAGMPDGFIPPAGFNGPAPGFNITAAMKDSPDVVIINYPSNDVNFGVPMAAYLSNLRTMYHIVTDAGKICYITTTQPRNFPNQALLQLLKTGRDSIIMEFGPFTLDFYDQLIIPNTLNFNPSLLLAAPPDTVHPNNAGHALLFSVVKNKVVLPGTPLPLLLTGFSARIDGGAADIRWATGSEQGLTRFDVQKSTDGQSFATAYEVDGKGGGQENAYSWIDKDLLPGTSYYRVRMIETGKESFSQIISLSYKKIDGLIARMHMQGTNILSVEMNITRNGPVEIALFTAGGTRVLQQSVNALSPSAKVSLTVPELAAGIYFLKITTAGGEKETKAFSKF